MIRLINERNELFGVRPIQYEKMSLKPGDKLTKQELWPFNENSSAHVAFRNEANIIPIWVPEMITYADGKQLTLTAPQTPAPAADAKK
jgi:hypothetical protein